jgi:predicted lipoprotein with Yx(FWY)xxD motif
MNRGRSIGTAPRFVALALAANFLVAACGLYGGASSAPAPTGPSVAASAAPSAPADAGGGVATIAVAAIAGVGDALVDADGRTLYVFTNDSPGTSSCAGECATNWPPLVVDGTPTAGDGVSGALGTLTREDGTTQVTYDGAPLYRFIGDAAPGDAKGSGLNGVWFVAGPGGAIGSPSGTSKGDY